MKSALLGLILALACAAAPQPASAVSGVARYDVTWTTPSHDSLGSMPLGNGDVGVFGGHVDFGDARRYWDFRSVGRGDINFEEIIVALNDVNYRGPLSVEWEDGRMDRVHGGTEAAAFVKKLDFAPSKLAFDSAFDKKNQ